MTEPNQSKGFPSIARRMEDPYVTDVPFTICTMVTDPLEYAEMLASFVAAGFAPEDCEYLYCDNTGAGALDAFMAYNRFLEQARGRFVILCHQDVLLPFDRRDKLEACLADLDRRDPAWALCGNAGGIEFGRHALCVTHSDGVPHRTEGLPIPVVSLDENFIVVKRSANLAVSHDLRGFHFYGTDLCRVADFLGRTAWVIDFHLLHKSTGRIDDSFHEALRSIIEKYQRTHRDGYIQTTCAVIPTGRSRWMIDRAMYARRHFLMKISDPSPQVLAEIQRIGKDLGPLKLWIQGGIYSVLSPLHNLRRSLRKRSQV